MSLILQLETATTSCSVALSENGGVISFKEQNERNLHASHITLFIQEVLEKAGKKINEIEAVAISMGPGSYTGLRIGVSTAKGLCFALDVPLISINTLEAMTAGMVARTEQAMDFLFCPMIDARRMEVFTAMFNNNLEVVLPTEAKIIDQDSFADFLEDKKIKFFGDGAFKCSAFLNHSNATIVSDFVNSATDMTAITFRKFNARNFEDIAYFEPFYLKDFVATTPKKLNL